MVVIVTTAATAAIIIFVLIVKLEHFIDTLHEHLTDLLILVIIFDRCKYLVIVLVILSLEYHNVA